LVWRGGIKKPRKVMGDTSQFFAGRKPGTLTRDKNCVPPKGLPSGRGQFTRRSQTREGKENGKIERRKKAEGFLENELRSVGSNSFHEKREGASEHQEQSGEKKFANSEKKGKKRKKDKKKTGRQYKALHRAAGVEGCFND